MDIPEEQGYYVYLIKCKDDSLYCGWTNNLKRRYEKHVSGKGAKYTKAHPPVALYYWEQLGSASEAMKREYQIKQMSHKQKLSLLFYKVE